MQRNKYIQAGLSVHDPNFPPPPGVKRVEVCALKAYCESQVNIC